MPSATSPQPRLTAGLAAPFAALLAATAAAEEVPAEAVPEPYRRLLVHDDDMTSTLAAFHGEQIALRVLERRVDGDVLDRRVTLVGAASGRVVEVGAIRIALAPFAGAALGEVLAGARPLGAVLAAHAIPFVSRPRSFLRLPAAAVAVELPDVDPGELLWGRWNRLTTATGAAMAEVVEILPPLDALR